MRFVPLAVLLAVIVEIAVFVLLGRTIGFGLTILLVLVVSLAGLALLRREGVRAWRGFRAATSAGQPPGPQVTNGLVGLGAGLLLAIPGLVSGLMGLLLVVPPVRALARNAVRLTAERRMSSMVAGDLFGPRRVRVRRGQPTTGPAPATDAGAPPSATASTVDAGDVVEGEIVEPRPR